MATMIPNDVEEFGTEGERVFYRFLQSVAKPDLRYVDLVLREKGDFILVQGEGTQRHRAKGCCLLQTYGKLRTNG
jgi:hypothetical protein